MKKRNLKKVLALCAGITVLASSAAGCNKKIYISTGLKDDELFKMSKEVCMLPEALVVLTAEKSAYEESYGTEILNKWINGTSLAAEIKKQIKTKLANIYGRKLLAQERGIVLTEHESSVIEEASKAFYATLSAEEISYLGISTDNIYSLYSALYLGDKVYKSIVEGVDYEVSDSEARVIKVQSIYIKAETPDEAGAEQMKIKAAEAAALINEGNDFSAVAKKYTDDGTIEFEFGRGTMRQEYEDAAFVLKKGEVSDIILTDGGCYIIKCIEDYLEDKTLDNKVVILEKYKDKAFEDIYKPFMQNISSEFNDELWDGITFTFAGNVKASGLHKIYAEYVTQVLKSP